jgi:hypothetical protein
VVIEWKEVLSPGKMEKNVENFVHVLKPRRLKSLLDLMDGEREFEQRAKWARHVASMLGDRWTCKVTCSGKCIEKVRMKKFSEHDRTFHRIPWNGTD